MLAWFVCWVLLGGPTAALAQAHAAEPPEDELTLAVVVESCDGKALARRMRTLLAHHLKMKAELLQTFAASDRPPDVVVTVAADSKDEIHVLYWDRTGMADVLIAPRPLADSSTDLVAASLAVALVRRNMPALRQALLVDPLYHEEWPPSRTGRSSALSALSPAELRRFLSRLGVVAHRTEALSEADF